MDSFVLGSFVVGLDVIDNFVVSGKVVFGIMVVDFSVVVLLTVVVGMDLKVTFVLIRCTVVGGAVANEMFVVFVVDATDFGGSAAKRIFQIIICMSSLLCYFIIFGIVIYFTQLQIANVQLKLLRSEGRYPVH